MDRLRVYTANGEPRLARYATATFDPSRHPRGKPQNAGEFRSKAEIAASTPAGRASVRSPVPVATPLPDDGSRVPIARPATRSASLIKVGKPTHPNARSFAGHAVGFVSPETREGLDLSEAAVAVLERRQQHAMRLFKEIDASLGLRTSVDAGIGSWAPEGQDPGAEPTTVTTYRGAPDFDAIRYATAAKAYAAHQHQALAFGCDPKGPDRLWSLEVAADLSGLSDLLSAHGIDYRTIRLSNGGKHQVLIYDQGGKLAPNVRKVAESVGARPGFRAGRGEFLGGDGTDRAAARESYRKVMEAYERRHPDRPRWDLRRGILGG